MADEKTNRFETHSYVAVFSLIGAAVLVIAAIWVIYNNMPSHPFPEKQDIHSVQIKFLNDRNRVMELDVPKEQWGQLFSCLMPSQYDRNPAKWQVFATMIVMTKNGAKQVIDIYDIPDGIGGFSDETDSDHRIYYRGGDSKEFIALVNRLLYAQNSIFWRMTERKKNGRKIETQYQLLRKILAPRNPQSATRQPSKRCRTEK